MQDDDWGWEVQVSLVLPVIISTERCTKSQPRPVNSPRTFHRNPCNIPTDEVGQSDGDVQKGNIAGNDDESIAEQVPEWDQQVQKLHPTDTMMTISSTG